MDGEDRKATQDTLEKKKEKEKLTTQSSEHRQLHECAAEQHGGVHQPEADGLARAGLDTVSPPPFSLSFLPST